jgi:hypothetical protein
MLKWFFALALTLLSFGAQAQRGPVYLPSELVKAVAQPGYAEKSLIQKVRFPRGTFGGSAAVFNGNPNVTISAIGGSIATSRDAYSSACELPCHIMVSASAITADGSSAPYEDLSYSWDFGEGCGPTFTRPTDGNSVCAGTGQRQPEAVYRFDAVGTKTIALTVTGCVGSIGTPNSANQGICGSLFGPVTFTKSITVSAFSGARNEFADCSFVGTPLGTESQPWNTLALVNTSLATGNVAMHFKPGTDCSTSTVGLRINPSVSISKIRIDKAYPGFSGANPRVLTTSGSTAALEIKNGGGGSPAAVSDVVITDIDFTNVSAASTALMTTGGNNNAAGTAGMRNIYLDNVNFRLECDCASVLLALPGQPDTGLPPVAANWGFWNVTTWADTSFTTVGFNELGSPTDWWFRVGGTITGPGLNPTFYHHVYNEMRTHGLYQWVTCGPTGSGANQRGYCFNGNYDGTINGGGENNFAEFITYAENSCRYTQNCIDLGNRTNNNRTFTATGSISGTTLTVTAFTVNTAFLGTANGGSYLISGANGGGSDITANTRIVGDASVNSGACTPACTGTGSTGTYAVSISQTFASASFIGADSTVQFRNTVIAANAMDGMAQINFQCGLSVTIRDNRAWNLTSTFPQFFALPNTQRVGFAQGAVSTIRLYRNKVYAVTGISGSTPLVEYQSSWTAAQWFTDNWIVDNRASGRMISVPWTDMLTAGSVMARNVYSQTAGNTSAWYDASTSKTFAQWQAAGTTPDRWDPSPAVNLAGSTPLGWTLPVTQWSHMN